MSDQAEAEPSGGEYGRGDPLRKGWQSSRLFNQEVMEDPRWMEVVLPQRSLAACSWPGYIPTPLFVPYISGTVHHPRQKIGTEQYKWRVSLDVVHFAPSEISLSVRDGFLEVGGKHEERPDQHGFIARCFTRKYRLPAEIEATRIVSSLSVDGILTVEAPVPEASVPAAIIIPIKVEIDVTEGGPPPDSSRAPAEDHQAEPPLEEHGDQAHPGTAAGLQQHDGRREQEEETHERPAGESHPSAPADGEGSKSLHDAPEQHEALESKESPDANVSQQLEHEGPAGDAEVQVMAGSGEATGEITQPQEPEPGRSPSSEAPSQQLVAPEQQHSK